MLSHGEKSIRDERKSEFPRVVNMLEKIRRAEFSNPNFFWQRHDNRLL